MALTLKGTTKWASTKELQRLGETRMGGTPARVRQILERIEAAIADTSKDLLAHIEVHTEFMEIGNRMLQQWEEGFTRKPQGDEPATRGKNYITRSGLQRLSASRSPSSANPVGAPNECG